MPQPTPSEKPALIFQEYVSICILPRWYICPLNHCTRTHTHTHTHIQIRWTVEVGSGPLRAPKLDNLSRRLTSCLSPSRLSPPSQVSILISKEAYHNNRCASPRTATQEKKKYKKKTKKQTYYHPITPITHTDYGNRDRMRDF